MPRYKTLLRHSNIFAFLDEVENRINPIWNKAKRPKLNRRNSEGERENGFLQSIKIPAITTTRHSHYHYEQKIYGISLQMIKMKNKWFFFGEAYQNYLFRLGLIPYSIYNSMNNSKFVYIKIQNDFYE